MPEKLTQGPRIGYDARVGAGLSRGPNLRRTLDAAAWAGTWPAPGSTLDLDFENNRGWVRGYGQGGVMDALTFTRASNGTYVGSDGLLKTAGYGAPASPYTATSSTSPGPNLWTYSSDFSNAAWLKSGLSVASSSETPPSGVDGVFRLTEASGAITLSALRNTSVATNNGTNHVISVFAKEDPTSAKRYLTVGIYYEATTRWAWAIVDVSTGAWVQRTDGIQSGIAAAFVEPLSGGWVRVAVHASSPLVGQQPSIGVMDTLGPSSTYNLGGYTGDGASGMFIAGAQIEIAGTIKYRPRFDWAATAQVEAKNRLLFTEELDNSSYWIRGGITPVALGGGVFKLVEQAAAPATSLYGNNLLSGAVIPPFKSGVFSVDVKSSERSQIGINYRISTAWGWIIVDIPTGSLVGGANGGNAGLTLLGFDELPDGWKRIRVQLTQLTNLGSISVSMATAKNGEQNYTGDGTSGVLVRFPQVEFGTTATSYMQVGSALATITPLTPTITCNGLLLEEARTNRILWCRDVTNASWVKTNVTVAKDQTGIDGVANAASSLTATADGGTCVQTITLASGSRTGSAYLKRITGTGTVQVSLDGTTWSSVELSSTEWRRVVLSGTVTNPVVGIRLATSGDAVAMDFAQLEDLAGASSPILTTNTTATRAGEVCALMPTAFQPAFDIEKVTFYAEADPVFENGFAGGGTVLGLSTNSNNYFGSVIAWDQRPTVGFMQPVANSVLQTGVQKYKIATSFSQGSPDSYAINRSAAINGVNYPNSGNTFYPAQNVFAYDRLGIGCGIRSSSTSAFLNGRVKRVVSWPQFMSETALLEMTK